MARQRGTSRMSSRRSHRGATDDVSAPPRTAVVTVLTTDDVQLAGVYLPRESELAFVVAHGMTNDTGRESSRLALDAFAEHGAVVGFDFRGHGRSGGRSTVGRDEVRDLDAAIAFARAQGHRRVAVIGFSMGGAVALRHAGLVGQGSTEVAEQPDVVISISAPSRWFLRDSDSMRRVQWLLEHPLGAIIAPRLGIRLGRPWTTVPTTPLELVSSISPTPLLIVHGTADHYFDPQQARDLHLAAPGSELWLIDSMAHAESGISRATIDRVADWAAAKITTRTAAIGPAQVARPGTLDR